jgi:amino acid adenylation domain-containing protein
LDPAWPTERVKSLVEDSGAVVLVASRSLGKAVVDIPTLSPVEEAHFLGRYSAAFEGPEVGEQELAYVIYTSGSTGRPKGVEITQGNLASLVAWHLGAFGVTAEDRGSHLAGLGFDASVWEVWPYLAAGASVVLCDEETRTSPELLRDWLVAQSVTVSFVPTALAEPMMAMEWPGATSLRFLLTGGEPLHAVPRAGLPFAVVNNYGPTECTVVATSGVVSAETPGVPTIGSAIAGTRVSVLDQQGRPCWIGETGELFIGGAGVGRGYRNLPELTARHFVLDPASGARLYRTGDRAAMLANGEVVFRGRVDGQEKLRGQRLELDEIVCVLNRHPEVAFSAVVALGEGSEKRLVAYVLPVAGAEPGANGLREFLAESLPAFMLPAIFLRLTDIPVNANGKLERERLPAPGVANRLREVVSRSPTTPAEATLLDMVRRLVGLETMSVDDDFFMVGGHSLLGTQLVMRVRERFGVPLTLRDLFEGSTVALLAARVETLLLEELESMSEEEAMQQVME